MTSKLSYTILMFLGFNISKFEFFIAYEMIFQKNIRPISLKWIILILGLSISSMLGKSK